MGFHVRRKLFPPNSIHEHPLGDCSKISDILHTELCISLGGEKKKPRERYFLN